LGGGWGCNLVTLSWETGLEGNDQLGGGVPLKGEKKKWGHPLGQKTRLYGK